MNDIIFYYLGVLLLLVIIYVILKELLPYLGRKNILFTTIKKGRIKCIVVGEKIKGYYCNLEDLGVSIKRKTGEIINSHADREMENSILWNYFGVIWIGFGAHPLSYNFTKDDGEKIRTENIWYKNQTIITLKDVECEGVVRLNLKVQIIIQTENAGYSLNYEDWITAAKNQIATEIRLYVSEKNAKEIFQQKSENDSDLKKRIIGIYGKDVPLEKNILRESFGQIVVNVNLIEVDFSSDFKSAMEAERRAEEERKAGMKNVQLKADEIREIAKAQLEAAEKKAEGIKKLGDAENYVDENKAKILGKSGATSSRQAEKTKEAVENFKGNVLSINSGNIPVVVDEKTKKKDDTE